MPEPEQPSNTPEPNPSHRPDVPARTPHFLTRAAVVCWTRRRLRFPIVGLLILGFGLLMLTQTAATKWWLIPVMEKTLGAKVESRTVRFTLGGSVVLRGVKLTVPGAQGEAARFLEASRIVIGMDYATGSPKLSRVELDEPIIRVSVDEELDLNVQPVFEARRADTSGGELPVLRLRDGVLEIGEHTAAGGYSILRRMRIDGELSPDVVPNTTAGGPLVASGDGFTSDSIGYRIDIRDLDDEETGASLGELDVAGTITKDAVRVEVNNFSLGAWPASRAPGPFRAQLEQLNVRGEIPRAVFTFGPDIGFIGQLDLRGVAVNLPFGLRADEEGRFARMSDVTGFVRLSEDGLEAELDGLLEDLPYEVTLEYDGLSEDAPFRAELNAMDFRLAERPDLLPFVPDIVAQNLDRFTQPTALVDAIVLVERPSAGGDIEISGSVEISEGVAAYAGFPYPFEDIDARVSFNSREVSLDSFTGRAVNGASVEAEGLFAPIGPTSRVEITVRCEDVPIDGLLRDALGLKRRDLVDSMFSEQKYNYLKAEGLFEDRPFELGATGDFDVKVVRQEGVESIWTRDIRAVFRDISGVSKYFPVPVRSDEVVLRIDDEKAIIEPAELRSLSGGVAILSGTVVFPTDENPGGSPPDISIAIDDAVYDDFIIRAIPDSDPGGPTSIRRMLRALNGSGVADADVVVLGRDDGSVGFDADIDMSRFTIEPRAQSPRLDPRLRVNTTEGRLRVSERGLEMSIAGDAQRLDGGAIRGAGSMTAQATAEFFKDDDARVRTTVTAANADLEAHVEDLTNAFNPDAGQTLADLRELWKPMGRADLRVDIDTYSGGRGATTVVDVLKVDDASIWIADGRLGLANSEGDIVARVRDETTYATLIGAEADLFWNGQPAGWGWLNGTAALSAEGFTPAGWSMDGAVLGVDAGDPIARAFLVEYAPPNAVQVFDDFAPTGEIDLSANLSPGPLPDGLIGPRLTGFVYPDKAEITFNEQRIDSESARGAMTFSPEGVGFEALEVFGPDWAGRLDGSVTVAADGAAAMELDVALQAETFSDDLRILAPPDVLFQIDKLQVDVEGPIDIGQLHISARRNADRTEAWSRAEGTIVAEGATVKSGVLLTEASAAMSFDSYTPAWPGEPNDEPAEFRMDLYASSARANGVAATDLVAKIVTADKQANGFRPIIAPHFGAAVHDGRVSGQAIVRPESKDAAMVSGEVRLSGLQLEPVLEDLPRARAIKEGREPPEPSTAGPQGRLDGQLTFGGVPERTETWRGRGIFRASGGPIVALPVIVPMLEIGNLTPPRGAQLDSASVSFFVDGPQVVFEDLSVFSDTLVVLGHGTATLPELDVDLRFRTQARQRIPLLSDVVDRLRDELLTVRVSGQLADPTIAAEPLDSTRRALARMFGARVDEDSQRLDEIEREARQRYRGGAGFESRGAKPLRPVNDPGPGPDVPGPTDPSRQTPEGRGEEPIR